ncbi:CHAT domain-containing protein [Kitasatospora sp. CM 4170]|uniref:CHAT domain-containing protein n=1 Tax=Kitasatospora aburaviensis TaxID=67265 RepID=A0ABW1EW60_9ACTN|nr:CHAT domain-containing protein [Kitasatospora sp. CM 4170]WNM43808.1 CHAT domain-containing protein [Kitasatospora sp. CM 4170]
MAFAQTVLEVAVEWRMPEVERWAVAWLYALGSPFLRLRWSSRSRDGRFRRDGRATASVTTAVGAERAAMLGTASGAVERWAPDEGLTTVARLPNGPVRALAVLGEQIFAGGPHATFTALGMTAPPPLEPLAAITAAAIGPRGWIGCGDELGRVFLYRSGADSWDDLRPPGRAGGRVVAVAFREDTALHAVWADGSSATWAVGRPGAGQAENPQLPLPPASRITAAAWDQAGERLAVVTAGGEVLVQGCEGPPRPHPAVRAVAWLPDGRLASASLDSVLITEPRTSGDGDRPDTVDRLTGDDAFEHIAVLGSRHLITTCGVEVVQWDLARAGSEMTTIGRPTALTGQDTVTAVAAAHRGLAAVGTAHGRVRAYDGRGTVIAETTLSPAGPVYQLVPHGAGWLIAGHYGAYRWDPHAPAAAAERLSSTLCPAVAQRGGLYARAEAASVVVMRHGQEQSRLELASTVADIRFANDGTMAAIDDGGKILVRAATGGTTYFGQQEVGSRLLGFGTAGPLVHKPGGSVKVFRIGRASDPVATLPAGAWPVAVYDDHRYALADPDRGIRLGSGGPHEPAAPWAAQLAVADRRIVAAAGARVLGYDVADPEVCGTGMIRMRITAADEGHEGYEGYGLSIPDGGRIVLSTSDYPGLRTQAQSIDDLSKAVFDAGRAGELLWQAGVDLAVDTARGSLPDRPVRIELDTDSAADDLPWELLHAANAPLGWFNRPPVTIVRTVAPDRTTPHAARPAPARRPVLLVVRGTDRTGPDGRDLLESVDEAYDLIQRRTRRGYVRLSTPTPCTVETETDLAVALRRPADLLQLWAHCAPDRVQFSDPDHELSTHVVANYVAAAGPRLVVLVGCHSGALGRLLVRLGVPCVVAMRSQVYSHTVQPLVEDFTALVLEGTPVDLAFAEALHRYVLTGQPGAAAVPMLYVGVGSDLVLFPGPLQAEPLP